MPVNLLPQTPPQPHADVRPACAGDDASTDPLTFSQSLAAATTGKGASATTNAQAATRSEAPVDPKSPRGLSDEELAALIAAPLAAPATPTSLAPSLAKPIDDPRAATDSDTPAQTPSPDAASLVSATLALLNAQPVAAPTRPAIEAASAERAVTSIRADAKAGERSATTRLQNDASVGETAQAPARPALVLATAEALSSATRAVAEPKDIREPRAANDIARTDSVVGAAQSVAPSPPPVQLTIDTPAFAPGWRDEVAQQLTQLVVLRQDRAEIRLHPADLGPISVQIQMDGGQANLLIQAPQPATRDGLELALPQLRDSLAQQGIMLGEASIRDQRQPDQQDAQRSASYASGTDARATAPDVGPVVRARVGLVDLFA